MLPRAVRTGDPPPPDCILPWIMQFLPSRAKLAEAAHGTCISMDARHVASNSGVTPHLRGGNTACTLPLRTASENCLDPVCFSLPAPAVSQPPAYSTCLAGATSWVSPGELQAPVLCHTSSFPGHIMACCQWQAAALLCRPDALT